MKQLNFVGTFQQSINSYFKVLLFTAVLCFLVSVQKANATITCTGYQTEFNGKRPNPVAIDPSMPFFSTGFTASNLIGPNSPFKTHFVNGVFDGTLSNNNFSFVINGNFIVDVPITFEGALIQMAPDAAITINNNQIFTLANKMVGSTGHPSLIMAGCGQLWKGFDLSGNPNAQIIIFDSQVQDAIVGIKSLAVAGVRGGYYTINGGTFLNSHIGIQVADQTAAGTYAGTIIGSAFVLTNALLPDIYGNNYNTNPTYNFNVGMWLSNIRNIAVGNSTSGNSFSSSALPYCNLPCGIYINRCGATITNNTFNGIFPNGSTNKFSGTAIANEDVGASLLFSSNVKIDNNNFYDCRRAIYQNMNLSIPNSYFTNISITNNLLDHTATTASPFDCGIEIYNIQTNASQQYIYHNTIKGYFQPVFIDFNKFISAIIDKNTIDNTTNTNAASVEAVRAIWNGTGSLEDYLIISNNTFTNVQTGGILVLSGLIKGTGLQIFNNTINMPYVGMYAAGFGANGIVVSLGGNGTLKGSLELIKGNIVTLQNPPSISSPVPHYNGIYVNSTWSASTTVQCNEIHNCQSGIRVSGANLNVQLVGNLLEDNYDQIIVDNSLIGDQGDPTKNTCNFNKWKYSRYVLPTATTGTHNHSDTYMLNSAGSGFPSSTHNTFYCNQYPYLVPSYTNVYYRNYRNINLGINSGISTPQPLSTITNADPCLNNAAHVRAPHGFDWGKATALADGSWGTALYYQPEGIYMGQQLLYDFVQQPVDTTLRHFDSTIIAMAGGSGYLPDVDFNDNQALRSEAEVYRQQLVADPTIADFVQDNTNTSIGQFYAVAQLIQAANYAAAATANAAINASLQPEINQQLLNAVWLQHQLTTADTLPYDSAAQATLSYIANQCILKGGNAVLAAQVLLQKLSPDLSFNYLSLCHEVYDSAFIDTASMRIGNSLEQQNEAAALNNKVAVYPNPATSMLTISSSFVAVQYIEVVDLLGRQQLATTITDATLANNFDMDISHIANGIYQLKITLATGSIINRKFVKQ